jgi:hypothetical protein
VADPSTGSSARASAGAYGRILVVHGRLSRMWFALPVVLGVDLTLALNRGLPWRGELAWCIESLAPALLLLAPFVAGVGAWQARRDAATDRSGLLRACAHGSRQIAAQISVGSLLVAGTHLLVLLSLAGISLHTARIGTWPVGAVLVQLVAFPAFLALGYLVGHAVDHVVAPILAAVAVMALGYTDYLTRLPLGFLGDGTTGTLLGYHQSVLAVVGRVAWCAAITVLCLLSATQRFAAGEGRPAGWVTATVLLGLAATALLARPQVWQFAPGSLTADRCAGERPRTCTLPAYADLLPRTAGIVTRTAHLLESTGALGIPLTYVGWWPTVPPSLPTVSVAQPGTADRPAAALVIAADVVAPTNCPQWRSNDDLGPAVTAQGLVLSWLVRQDPELGPGAGSELSGVDDRAFGRLSAAIQRVWVGRATTALAACRFADLPALPSGP